MNQWCVHVTNFGKIDSADIQMAPLTFFLGDNNSGKSYMMTLIYGLLKTNFFFEEYDFCTNTKAYKECYRILDDLLREAIKGIAQEYILKGTEMKAFENLLNHILSKEKKKFIKKLFNKEIEIDEFSVNFSEKVEYILQIEQFYTGKDNERSVGISANDMVGGYSSVIEGEIKKEAYQFFISFILQYMLRKDYRKEGYGDVVYFPTARTGFMLTYKALIGNAIRETFTEREIFEERDTVKKLLTKPNVDFLSNLSKISSQHIQKEYQEIVDFVEQNLIYGKVTVANVPANDILYIPNNSEEALPLHITSGVVTELAPLLLMFKHMQMDTMLIEEPEISLHPKLQLEMARTLVRIANKKIPVFVTTHCDIIIQHINNMIKATELKEKELFLKQYNYEQKDLISREKVALYQFDVKENQRTQVTKIPCGDYGFETITFYDTLKHINDQIDEIENLKNAEETEA